MSGSSAHSHFTSLSSHDQENLRQSSSNDLSPHALCVSSDTVHHISTRDSSLKSVASLGPYASGPLRVRNANMQSSNTSPSTIHLFGSSDKSSPARKASKRLLHGSSWGNYVPVPPHRSGASSLLLDAGPLEDVDLDAVCSENQNDEDSEKMDRNLSFEATTAETLSTQPSSMGSNPGWSHMKPSILITDTTARVAQPFRRWMTTLRHKNSRRKGALIPRRERWSLDDFDETEPAKLAIPQDEGGSRHKKSSSWSSSGFVTAVKSATVSLGPLSAAPQRRRTRTSTQLRSSNRSSGISDGLNRASIDSSQGSTQIIDEAAWNRAIQRRRTLEELISSEESYIADLKVLINVYFTLIASASNDFQRKSPQIHCNISEILTLHEELLLQIRRVIPDSDLRSDHEGAGLPRSKHTRWHSVESSSAAASASPMQVARRSFEATWFGRPKRGVLISEPREVAEVAKVFGRLMGRFFVYEEYGAKYESMILDMTSASKNIPNWHVYERGIEALAHSLASTSSRTFCSRKGLTFEDLLIKPIQRVCKYPLLFADLEKNTPVIDGPECRTEVEKVLCRLRDTAYEINRATNDQETRARIQRSWHLQDLLILPDVSTAPASLRLLGQAALCGVLYVAYQSKSDLRGEYMLCVLFRSYLLLASPKPGTTRYMVTAILSLRDTQIDESDNGRGLQCHMAPYSWKFAFESDQQLYELVLCACSAREEEQWKSSLLKHSTKETQMQKEDQTTLPPLFFILSLDIQSLGYVFGLPGTLTYRISIQRAATVGPRTGACRVIIKNTHALKDHCDSPSLAPNSMSRSQSLLSTNRVLILAPKRADRIRMEYALTDVWTRDLLPYPGMNPNRGEHLIRTSANSVMRKLSRASLTTSFSKRSTSNASLVDEKWALGQFHIEPIHELGASDGSVSTLHHAPSSSSRAESKTVSRARCVEPPPRTSSVRALRFSRARGSVKHRQGLGLMAKAVSCEEVSKLASPREMIRKRGSPRMHLKTFSADGIRNWFTHA